jgi:hypothetical protein
MKLQDFIDQAQSLKDSWKDKEVVIEAENGLLFEPKIKLLSNDNLGIHGDDTDKIKRVIITY